MARKRLSDQQQHRVDKNIENLVNDFLANKAKPGLEQATVISHQSRIAMVKDKAQHVHKALLRQNIGAITCGDKVILERHSDLDKAAILAILPRQSYLEKSIPSGLKKLVAANVDFIIIVIACEPEPQLELLDRYLLISENANITPVIVLNKTDSLDKFDHQNPPYQLTLYQELGYKVLYTSVKQKSGLEALLNLLQYKTGIFVGQSGVGKSSLTQTLIPDLDVQRSIQIGPLSNSSLGRHTTSMSVLYSLPNGGHIIDSPGVRDIGVWHLQTKDIEYGFTEFRAYLGHCKFSNCTHEHEPKCALLEAVQQGYIAPSRFNNYRNMLKLRKP